MKNRIVIGLISVSLAHCGRSSEGQPKVSGPVEEKTQTTNIDSQKIQQDGVQVPIPDGLAPTPRPALSTIPWPLSTTTPDPLPKEDLNPNVTPTPIATTLPNITLTPIATTLPNITPTPMPVVEQPIRVIIGELDELPLDMDPVCDEAHVGQLTLSITSYSDYRPTIRLCVQKESWGEVKFDFESIPMEESFLGERVKAQSVASAVVWNSQSKKVESYLLGSKVWTDRYGTNCSLRSSITSGGSKCGHDWNDPETGEFFASFSEQFVNLNLGGNKVMAPLFKLKSVNDLPAQTLDSLLALLQTQSDNNKQWGLLSAISAKIQGQDIAIQKSAIDQVYELVVTKKLEQSSFHSFLGNTGSSYALDFTRPLLTSGKIEDLRSALSMIRLLKMPEALEIHLKAFDGHYTKSLDVGSQWGDFESRQVIRTVIEYLKAFGGSKERDHVRTLRDASSGRNRDVENYLKI